MADQRYVYTLHETEVGGRKMGDLESIINEYAREGWRLSESLQRDGTTVGLVFERQVEG
ncbi:MAG: hypothetical protein V5A55_09685 [Halovenus sp.]